MSLVVLECILPVCFYVNQEGHTKINKDNLFINKMTEYEKQPGRMSVQNVLITSLIAGGAAGTFVDITLYPLDTLKTRLQSKQGFLKTGGFTSLYKGIYPVIIGSAPTAALFFLTYEEIKNVMQPKISKQYHTSLHMGAATLAEMVACLIRVPVEVLKQRKQAQILDKKFLGFKLLYRGYWSTVLRDTPFSIVQFPLWEYLKTSYSSHIGREIYPSESAICGAISVHLYAHQAILGGISAAVTTPLDVAKTRIMLSGKTSLSSELTISNVLYQIYAENGFSGLFAGFGPRVTWITLGGFIFFGVYEEAKVLTQIIFPMLK